MSALGATSGVGRLDGPVIDRNTAVLVPFVAVGALDAAGVQVAGTIARTVGDVADEVLLAIALAVRAVQLGHVCVTLADAARIGSAASDADRVPHGTATDGAAADARDAHLPWPPTDRWAAALRSSPAVTVRDPVTGAAHGTEPPELRPLVFDGDRVYLERYWRYERAVGDTLLARAGVDPVTPPDRAADIDRALDEAFGLRPGSDPDRQRDAARVALTSRLAVISGGPGTGKTHTVARLLAATQRLAIDAGRPASIALAAPTGKAAARLTDAVRRAAADAGLPADVAEQLGALEGSTLHRLLGATGGIRFRHDRDNPLPHDLVVVDETSMVALPLMARLLEAVRPEAGVVLVGDPYQLASIEAGAVLGDLVGSLARPASVPDVDGAPAGPLATNVVVLDRVHRFDAGSPIAALADAVRSGDADAALDVLRAGTDELSWVDPADVVALDRVRSTVAANAAEVVRAARDGDAGRALARVTEVKVLCATRAGSLGSYAWRDDVERRLGAQGVPVRSRWYVGRPVIATRNDHITRVFNGDTGVVVRGDATPTVALPASGGIRRLSPAQLADVETWWAMTIHKSQGSEFDHVVVSLPTVASPILTRELLYTGLTRARSALTLLATEDALRDAVATPIARASGLQDRLWPAATTSTGRRRPVTGS